MTKFNFFLVVEALLLTLGLITIFNNDIIRFIFIQERLCLDDLLDFTFFGFHVEYLCGSCYLSGCGLCHD